MDISKDLLICAEGQFRHAEPNQRDLPRASGFDPWMARGHLVGLAEERMGRARRLGDWFVAGGLCWSRQAWGVHGDEMQLAALNASDAGFLWTGGFAGTFTFTLVLLLRINADSSLPLSPPSHRCRIEAALSGSAAAEGNHEGGEEGK